MSENALGMDAVEKFVDEATGGDVHAARVLSLAGSVKGVLHAAALGVTTSGRPWRRPRAFAEVRA